MTGCPPGLLDQVPQENPGEQPLGTDALRLHPWRREERLSVAEVQWGAGPRPPPD